MGRPSKGGYHKDTKRLADGTQRTYWSAWKGGPRMPGPPGSKGFKQAYEAALAEKRAAPSAPSPRRHAETIKSIVDGFLDSQEFLQKRKPRTQRDYRGLAQKIVAEFGDLKLDALVADTADGTRGIFLRWRDRLAKASPRQADYAWSVLSAILTWAKRRGEIKVNPCAGSGVEKLYDVSRADKIWTDAWIAAFYEAASDEIALAMTLALWTGQRQGDLLRLTWSAYDGEFIRLCQGKGDIPVTIPVASPLKLALDGTRKRSPIVLVNQDGVPWSEDGFRVMWGKTCIKAGVPNSRHGGVTFHDLRGTAVTRLFIAGAHQGEIATLTGHSLARVQSILDKNYFHRDVRLAQSAIIKLERAFGK
jgi:integrase